MNDIDKYILQFPENVQHILQKIRKIIKDNAPGAEEIIAYGMPSYKTNRKPLVYFAAYKNHIGFYATPSGHLEFQKDLSNYKQGKGSVQFPIDKPLPYDLIEKIVKYRLKEETMNNKISPGILHDLPNDIEKALIENIDVLEQWNKLTPIQRNEWICWVTIVKKAETRAEHIERMITEIREGQLQPCCWPGCPHRKPSSQKWFKKNK
jgi:uncharacterized protein YdhG (YjbR/CyaY superfamily)